MLASRHGSRALKNLIAWFGSSTYDACESCREAATQRNPGRPVPAKRDGPSARSCAFHGDLQLLRNHSRPVTASRRLRRTVAMVSLVVRRFKAAASRSRPIAAGCKIGGGTSQAVPRPGWSLPPPPIGQRRKGLPPLCRYCRSLPATPRQATPQTNVRLAAHTFTGTVRPDQLRQQVARPQRLPLRQPDLRVRGGTPARLPCHPPMCHRHLVCICRCWPPGSTRIFCRIAQLCIRLPPVGRPDQGCLLPNPKPAASHCRHCQRGRQHVRAWWGWA